MSGEEEIWFIFQKLRYVYDAGEKKQFEEVKMPTDMTLRQYMEWKGYQDDEELHKAEKTFSKNKYTHPSLIDSVIISNSYKNMCL